ncbi:Gfo/Idh/MocA family protein [Marinitenerispora sediminis]|uniref:Oxidoreductase n=1 Tax=Marinitenerispora sediminis TaxID=1931232 RepID=A0A368T7M4_9ACTN|nr:Gfo/Idh/MocA family oxidoreductase [Marinitenerispora sediminis]RCV52018.1 oxidoreductase [Marinitenerispora sediminis]RCV56929.1 oxidoreductase [Marinitenerispora sediminis]RCV60053.1 oxidoreductase [Marinitenerispora sediminis]
MSPVRVLIVGAGSRGGNYAKWIRRHPEVAEVVAVAEPRAAYREPLADAHGIAPELRFADWREAAALPRLADAALVCTLDDAHLEPAVALAERGYHLLVEKPLAQTREDCEAIVAAARRHGVLLGVCHVLRYAPYTRLLKEIIDSGRIGEIVSVDHLEPVGFWHQAHSYVRGNWRSAASTAPMLMAKSCHDLDWLRHIVGRDAVAVSSFGSLRHFRADQAPPGAADRCVDCAAEPGCAYSAPRVYGRFLAEGRTSWPLTVLTPEPTEETVAEALRTGPYGRCVYRCDNDVVDHQVVSLEFTGGVTATFTMTAFNRPRPRETRIFGTRGELYCDGERITHYDFLTDSTDVIDVATANDGLIDSGHGGGDGGLLASFLPAVAAGDPSRVATSGEDALRSHLLVFAAEQARLEGRVVRLGPDGPGGAPAADRVALDGDRLAGSIVPE